MKANDETQRISLDVARAIVEQAAELQDYAGTLREITRTGYASRAAVLRYAMERGIASLQRRRRDDLRTGVYTAPGDEGAAE